MLITFLCFCTQFTPSKDTFNKRTLIEANQNSSIGTVLANLIPFSYQTILFLSKFYCIRVLRMTFYVEECPQLTLFVLIHSYLDYQLKGYSSSVSEYDTLHFEGTKRRLPPLEISKQ